MTDECPQCQEPIAEGDSTIAINEGTLAERELHTDCYLDRTREQRRRTADDAIDTSGEWFA